MVVKIVEFLVFDEETYKLIGRKKYFNMFTILDNTEQDKKLIAEFLKTVVFGYLAYESVVHKPHIGVFVGLGGDEFLLALFDKVGGEIPQVYQGIYLVNFQSVEAFDIVHEVLLHNVYVVAVGNVARVQRLKHF